MPYATHAEALAIAASIAKQTRQTITTYRCRECHQWHIGRNVLPPDPRIDRKQWKNWHWRNQSDDT